MTIEDDVKGHTAEIKEMVTTVTRLATIVEGMEKTRLEDRSDLKDAIKGIDGLKDQIGKALNMVADLAQCKEDVRLARHDVNTALNSLQALPLLNDRTIKLEGKVETLEKWQDRFDGASKTITAIIYGLWIVGGTGILSLIFFVLKWYFTGSVTESDN